MKRLVAIPAVLCALAVSGVAVAPASAVNIHGVEVTCSQGTNEATYTVTYQGKSYSFTLKYPGAKCLVGPAGGGNT
jgi:hypothetical protein